VGLVALAFACGPAEPPSGEDALTGGAAGTGGNGGTLGGSAGSGASGGSGAGTGGALGVGGAIMLTGGTSGAGAGGFGNAGGIGTRDPTTCEEAVAFRTYLGCEYFPTVLGNAVNPVFDFAVVVANPSDEVAMVHVDGPAGFAADASVGAHGLSTIYLPWVASLKGPNVDGVCNSEKFASSVIAPGGAYHLTSSRPVAAYQFNPLEFQAQGGPPGKVWACDPANICTCNTYANDASLLLPRNALTPNYVAFTWRDAGATSKPSYIAVTAVADGTEVVVKVGPTGSIQAGPAGSTLAAAGPGVVFSMTMNARDVVELMAVAGTDLSGTQVQSADAMKPIQVMSGNPAAFVPDNLTPSADHLEEIVFPAEAVGRDYVVPVPTGPHGMPVAHVVRLYGMVTATTLSYFPAPPMGAPTGLLPGTVAEFTATTDFQVQGTEPFGVGSFLVGGKVLDPVADPRDSTGDPSQTLVTGKAQFRERYVFLAPPDYPQNFVDIVALEGTQVTLDGNVLGTSMVTKIAGRADDGTTPQNYDVYRAPLANARAGQHELGATQPVGIQVVGFGRFTSYMYPGGLNLNLVSDPPPLPPVPK
jgi:hypothetical protein